MTEKKLLICCGSDEDLCKGYECKVEETDNGICICISSDDPEKAGKLKEKVSNCCSSESGKCC